nr:uncharacterized protein LOC110782571 [Spinacia oleracea]
MIWHDKDRKKENGVLRHPADTEAWQSFDRKYPEYALEPRNVRLGLASDGFNPFGEKRSTYSTWPVILAAYNLPPWLCMKKEYLMLSMIIPGPKSPGNDIDTYLQPLIDDLKELWEVGVPTYDAYKKETFQLHASLLWTINDFPAYGNLSGWCVYGKNACPCCIKDTWSKRYNNSGKVCYLGGRMFLDSDHKYRYDEKSFDNTKEFRPAPIPPSGSEVLEQLKNIVFTLGKTTKDEISGVVKNTWKKKRRLFNLPYWKDNLLRHNLDVMHIEKNLCDNIINTLLNVPKKSKDNLKARHTLEEIGVRKHLWPVKRGSSKWFLPPAPYNLSNQAKDRFCEVLENVKFPDGYASNISRCVMKRKLHGLKSHDCHVLMQLLLPLAMRESVNEKVASVLIELCDFFRALCAKTLVVSELEKLQKRIVVTLCNMEKIFPPTFFTIMVRLVVHLADEAKIGGPVHNRWMYPIERYLSTLNDYVRNKACPEGSIANEYLLQECLAYCARYMDDVEGRINRSSRNSTLGGDNDHVSGLFPTIGQPYGRKEGFMMDEKQKTQAHRYVLFNSNCKEMESLREEHVAHIKRITRRTRPTPIVLDRMHNEEFSDWLKIFVNDPNNQSDERITDDVKSLAFGPMPIARRFQAFNMNNGYKFRTKDYERNKKTQNSGVMVVAKTQSYASSRDTRPIMGDVTYYGVLTDIIELISAILL